MRLRAALGPAFAALAAVSCGGRTPLLIGSSDAGLAIDTGATADAGAMADTGATSDTGAAQCKPAPVPTRLYAPHLGGAVQDATVNFALTGDGQRLYVMDTLYQENGQTLAVVSIDPCTGQSTILGNAMQATSNTPPIYPFGGLVYWASITDSVDILSAHPLGGLVSQVMHFGQQGVATEIDAFAVDANAVYAALVGEGLVIAPLSGGRRTTVGANVFSTIPIVDDTHVYFAEGAGIARAPKRGGVETPLIPNEICVNGDDVLRALAGDATDLYAETLSPNLLWRIPKDGGSPVVLAPVMNCSQIAVDETYVYFAETEQVAPYTESIERIPKRGGARETVVSSSDVGGIYVDERSVYWVSFPDGVWKVDK